MFETFFFWFCFEFICRPGSNQREVSHSNRGDHCCLIIRVLHLVLRLFQQTAGQHKLSVPWEGPFIISKVLGNYSYYLIDAQKPRARKEDDSGKETERPWNANLLRRFYS